MSAAYKCDICGRLFGKKSYPDVRLPMLGVEKKYANEVVVMLSCPNHEELCLDCMADAALAIFARLYDEEEEDV